MQLREKVRGLLENRLTCRICPGKFNESVFPTQLRCTLKYEAHAILNINRIPIQINRNKVIICNQYITDKRNYLFYFILSYQPEGSIYQKLLVIIV